MDGPSRLPSPPQVLLSTYVCFPPQDRVHSRKEQDLFIPSGSKQITWQTGNPNVLEKIHTNLWREIHQHIQCILYVRMALPYKSNQHF